MNNRLHIIKLTILAILFIFSTTSYADHVWGNYHWARTRTPFTLQVIDSVTNDWQAMYDQSLIEWANAADIELSTTSANDSNRMRKRCPMANGKIRVCNAAYGFNGWLGLATIGIDPNGHIDRGTAKMNDSYSSYWSIPGEKNHVTCQEIGHLFGLGHTSEDGTSQQTCMDYSTDFNSQWPNQHDIDLLNLIYDHLDSFNSYDDSLDGGGDSGDGGGVCNAPPGKGCNKNNLASVPPMGVRVHKTKNHELWIAPRMDGGLWIHDIRLVPEDY